MKIVLPHYWRLSIVALGSLALSACDVTPEDSGGLGSGGGGQSPDPVVVDLPIAYIERPLPRDEDGMFVPHDVLDPAAFNPGARLLFKARASVPATAIDLTSHIFALDPEDPDFDPEVPPLYDVKDVSASADGSKLIFAMRAPEDPDAGDDEQPTWNIWEYDRDLDQLRRVIASDFTAEEGQDISPAYLPDGSIIFSSTRQRRSKAILLDENKPQFGAQVESGDEQDAFVLHVMDEDGVDIQQVTYNQSHDLYPTVLSSGEVVFLRWDNAAGRDRLSLYKMNPDGSNLTLLYGYHSQDTATGNSEGAFVRPQEMPDGRIMINLRPRVSEKLGGDMVMIDTDGYIDNTQPVASNPGGTGPAQESASVLPVNSDDSISSHGYFSSAYPMTDGTDRFLVSWSTCRVLGFALGIYVEATGNEDPEDPDQLYALINDLGEYVDEDGLVVANAVFQPRSELNNYPCTERTVLLPQIPEADAAYGIWVYNTEIATQAPVVLAENNMMFTDAIVLEPKTEPTYIKPIEPDDTNPSVLGYEDLYNQNLGVVHIRNVYDMDGTDTAPGGYNTLADPAQTMAAQRPARFLRITKAVSMPDDDVYDFDDSAFGFTNQMKDILGYVPIEPDGSAMFKVPADVAFAISILDENGKRTSARHQNWLTVRAGEVRHCNGCHSQNSVMPHGRMDAEPAPSNVGALSVSNFPNTVVVDAFDTPQPPPEVGETMAQYWTRVNGPRTPSVHINFNDDWTDSNVRAKDASFSYHYSGLASGDAPVTTIGCVDVWTAVCRVVINYVEHIQPLWEAPRIVLDPMDNMTVLADNTCISCHASVDAMGAAMVPAGNRQLDLSSTMSDERNEYLTSYAELFIADQAQELDPNGNLQNEQVQLVVDGVPQIEALDVTGATVNVDENIVVQNIQLIIDGVPQYQVAGADVINGTVSFDDIQTQIFDNQTTMAQRCRNCHTGATAADGSGGLNLDPAFAYAELMDVTDPRVVVGDPANSLLVQRLQGTIAPQMPLTGGPLSAAMIQMVISWIEFGAPQTGTGTMPCDVDECPDIVPGPIDDPNVILDGNGDPIPYMVPEYTLVLDGMGNTVPFMVPSGRQFGPLMNANGARASTGFFSVFEQGGGTVDHSSFLSPAELKMLAEWLDIGGQYYNNPFDAPAN